MKKNLFLSLILILISTTFSYAHMGAPLDDTSDEGEQQFEDVVLTLPEREHHPAARMSALAAPVDVTKTLYINFDGDVLNPGTLWNSTENPITMLPADLSASIKQTILARVQEAYSPYNVVVTTSSDAYYAAPLGKRQRCDVVKYNSDLWGTPTGGISYINSMTWDEDTPCFVFADLLGNTIKKVGDATTHEFGHSAGGLGHDSIIGTVNGSCAVVGTYKASVGSGPLSWGSIMGNSYAGTVATFNSASTPYCNTIQNDLDTMASNLGLKGDDVGNNFATATVVDGRAPYSKNMVLGSSTDIDMFQITSDMPKYLTLSSRGSTDFKITLYDANHTLLTVLNPTNTLSVPRTDISSYVAQNGPLYLSVERSNDDVGSYIPTTSGTGGAILKLSR